MRLTFKRLTLLGAHVSRGVARLVDLTQARLDLLALLMHGPLCQRDLAAKLCCCEAVVSRMVRALMEDGLVRREIPIADRRFRIVSLTADGRQRYLAVTDAEWLLPASARFDCSALGDNGWQCDWELPLERMGLAFLARMSESDYADHEPAEPPYTGLRLRHRSGCYRDALDPPDPRSVGIDWAWTATALEPPVDLGLEDDPLSVELLAAWRCSHPRGWQRSKPRRAGRRRLTASRAETSAADSRVFPGA